MFGSTPQTLPGTGSSTGTGSVVLSDSPTFTGTVTIPNLVDGSDTLKVMVANETRTSTVAMTNLTGLTLAVVSGETWQFEIVVYVRSLTLASSGGGAAVRTTGPAASWSSGLVSVGVTNTSPNTHIFESGGANGALYGTTSDMHSTNDGTPCIVFRYNLTVAFSASGTFSVQGSQKVTSVNATTFVQGTHLKCKKVN